ncbi:putative 3-hydroxyacyl-CoA dehydrogenase [Aspergillus affinis]|uniref:putative 3-hydroxyacyl-CoA dehydrogenase n=1 Tax=Aspergillus affinis TaxID=1070780 RepID=UPI0022FEC9D7|nr:putative 3-hydroxyacyl-CoA dehydrogenase [Aspergillus affinis]KAI9037922.1 putative 3-hydroxyacyl-CoA dehydrogenase [Aspergillus affinis]
MLNRLILEKIIPYPPTLTPTRVKMTAEEPPPSFKPNRVAVIGCGKLGRRIALSWSRGGVSVRICDTEPERAVEALNWVQETLGNSPSVSKENAGHVEIASTLADAVQDAWMVIESVPEQIALKTNVLGEIDKLTHQMTIIATNSSSIRSSRLVSRLSDERKCRFLNTHYCRPPEVPIVEIMACGRTSAAVIKETASQLESIRLEPLIVERESTGFVANRIWAAIKREVMFMLAERVGKAEDIDRVFKANLHAAWGPCELMDMVGLQTVCDIEDVYIEERNVPAYGVEFIRQNYVTRGYMGRDAGRGLMEYPLKPQPASIRDQLLGSWDLMEFTAMDTDGNQQHPFGHSIQGRLIYSADGYVSATLQLPGQEPFGGRDPRAGTESELAEASRRYMGYNGTFSTEENTSTPAVIHRVQYCNLPKLRGQAVRRFIDLKTVGCYRLLTLTCEEAAPSLEGGRETLRWRKATQEKTS